MYKTKMDKKPAHMFNKISTPFYVNTRLANTNGIKETWRFKTNIGKQSFMARALIMEGEANLYTINVLL